MFPSKLFAIVKGKVTECVVPFVRREEASCNVMGPFLGKTFINELGKVHLLEEISEEIPKEFTDSSRLEGQTEHSDLKQQYVILQIVGKTLSLSVLHVGNP
ncbi:hypothetical protein H920_09459 [Fukomys damarensis]|uniref:Uncharacterized protein n=1 Tax=Fukomys damarensis TaxID=885580 RepID=A0A091DF75_FUKDA|nr:hypothetical protein H920_09459 [Fukomys damarensis]